MGLQPARRKSQRLALSRSAMCSEPGAVPGRPPDVLFHLLNGNPMNEQEAIDEIKARVERLTHVARMKNGGTWVNAIGALLDLVETPNNLDALWVWSRFVWVFGRRNTWQADSTLEELLQSADALHRALKKTPPKRSLFRKRRTPIELAEDRLGNCLAELLLNEADWSEANEFRRYRGK